MYPFVWTHWRHLANVIELCFLQPTRVHNPNDKLIGSAIFAQLTAECRRVHCRHLANTIEIVYIGAIWWIPLNSCFFRTTQVHNPNSRSAQLTAECPYTLLYAPLFPKLPLPMGELNPHLTRDSLGIQAKWHLDQFCHFRTDDCRVSLYFTIGRPFPPSKLPLPCAHPSPQPKGHLERFSCFHRAH